MSYHIVHYVSNYVIFFVFVYTTYIRYYFSGIRLFTKHINFEDHLCGMLLFQTSNIKGFFTWQKGPKRLFRGFVRGWYPTQFCVGYFYKPWNGGPWENNQDSMESKGHRFFWFVANMAPPVRLKWLPLLAVFDLCFVSSQRAHEMHFLTGILL